MLQKIKKYFYTWRKLLWNGVNFATLPRAERSDVLPAWAFFTTTYAASLILERITLSWWFRKIELTPSIYTHWLILSMFGEKEQPTRTSSSLPTRLKNGRAFLSQSSPSIATSCSFRRSNIKAFPSRIVSSPLARMGRLRSGGSNAGVTIRRLC